MAIIASRTDLRDYCLRRLGEPVVEINIDEDQVEDRIDEALQFYQEYHSDAVVKNFLKHEVTQQNVDDGYISLPPRLISVSRIFQGGLATNSGKLFNLEYHMRMEDLLLMGHQIDLASWVQRQQYISLIDSQLNGIQQVRFSRHQERLYIDDDWSKNYPVGSFIIVEGYETVDPDLYTAVYNDRFLKKYATALIKQQWGQNLIKFEGMQLPGGVMLNGRQLYDDATAEIEQIEQDMQLAYEMPVDFAVG